MSFDLNVEDFYQTLKIWFMTYNDSLGKLEKFLNASKDPFRP